MVATMKQLSARNLESTLAAPDRTAVEANPDSQFDGMPTPNWSRLIVNALPLMLADIAALGVSLGFAYGLVWSISPELPANFVWLLMLMGLTMPLIFALFGLYPGTGLNAVAELAQVALATTLLFSIFIISAHTYGTGTTSVLAVFVAFLSLPAVVSLLRATARTTASSYRWWGQPVLVFGNGDTARQLYQHYRAHPSLGIRPIAIIDDWPDGSDSDRVPRHPSMSDRVETLRRKHDISWAVVTTPLSASSAAAVRSYLATFAHVVIVPDAQGLPSIRHQMIDCGHLAGIPMTNTLLLLVPRMVKTAMDYLLVALGGIVCLPLVIAIAALIKLTSEGPVFYAQSRVGKGNRSFRAWKFRTMIVDADAVLQEYLESDPALREEWERDHKLKNDPRVSSVGRWLRKTSLDELPQIWNVLRGEMSLVGPRPIVTAEIPKYGEWFSLYEKVTPGITGLWQISGRNNTTYEMRVAFDSYYVLNWSPWLDLYILARTIKVVFCHEGAY